MASSGDFFAVRCGHIHARTICEDVSGNVSQTGRRQTLSSHTHGHAPLSCPIVIPHRHTLVVSPIVIPHRHTLVVMPYRHAPSSCPIVMSHRHTTSSHTRGQVPSSDPIDTPYCVSSCHVVTSHRHRLSSCVIFIPYRHTLSACPMITSNCRIPSVCPTVIPIATSIVKPHRHTSFWHPIVILHRHTHRHIVTPIVCLSFVSVSLC